MAIKVGEKAPEFNLPGSDGKEHTLEEFKGKKVIIYFYPKDNTSGCTKEACGFKELHNEIQDLNAIVLGVSKDSLKSHDRFIEKFGLPFILLSDTETTMMQAYDAWGEKKVCGKVSIGCIRSTVVVDENGIVLKHWPKVKKAADHPKEVVEYLKEIS